MAYISFIHFGHTWFWVSYLTYVGNYGNSTFIHSLSQKNSCSVKGRYLYPGDIYQIIAYTNCCFCGWIFHLVSVPRFIFICVHIFKYFVLQISDHGTKKFQNSTFHDSVFILSWLHPRESNFQFGNELFQTSKIRTMHQYWYQLWFEYLFSNRFKFGMCWASS